MHPQMHPLQNVPAAVVDDATDFCSVEGAREVGVHVVVVVQAATEMDGKRAAIIHIKGKDYQ